MTRWFVSVFVIGSLFLSLAYVPSDAAGPPAKRVVKKVAIKEADVPQYLQDVSVTIRTSNAEGSGVLVRTKDGQVWIWTCGHVIADLRKERQNSEKKTIVNFDDAKVVSVHQEDGRKVGESNFDAEVIRYSDATTGEDLALLRLRTKKFKPAASAVFYLDKKMPTIGTKLLHCGSLLGTLGSNSVTNGIVSQTGRVLFNDIIFDQTNCASFPGSSGGIVCLEKDGRYVGMLVRGAGETFSVYVPIRRMLKWAKKTGVEFTIDPSLPIPSEEKLKAKPVDDSMSIKKPESDKTKKLFKLFPTKEYKKRETNSGRTERTLTIKLR